MKFRTLSLLFILLVVVLFAALNWTAFTTPTALSFGVTSLQAPLGMIMLALIVLLSMLFLLYVIYLQTSVLLEARRHARELQSSRVLADQAEASRFTELRAYLDARLPNPSVSDAPTLAALIAKLDQLHRDLHTAIEQSSNAVAAHIGELEDRLERAPGLAPRPD